MACRNLVRPLLAAALLAVSGAAAPSMLPAAPAGAADNNYVPVTVYEDGFNPATVSARPGDKIVFTLDTGVSDRHTVTLEDYSCGDHPRQLCDKSFDRSRSVTYQFSEPGSYDYYDKYARAAGVTGKAGTMVIADAPPPESSTTTTTTQPVPAPASTTTTTAPQAVHPFLVPDPGPTTTTTAAAARPAAGPAGGAVKSGAGGPAASAAKDAPKDKGKPKADEAAAPAPAPTDPSLAPVFDEASLTPGVATPSDPAAPGGDTPDVETAATGLINADNPVDDGAHLLLMAVASLGALLLVLGAARWHHRSSRYDPA